MSIASLEGQRLIALLRLGRPLHLAGGGLFYAIGLALALAEGVAINLLTALLGLGTTLTAQLLNHYSNDYFDYDTDSLNRNATRWSGGSRVLVSGALPRRSALYAGLICLGLALGFAIAAALLSGDPAATLWPALLAIGLVWAYSSPPFQLNRRALGELSGALLIPGITAFYALHLQAPGLLPASLWLLLPLCLLQCNMLLAVNLPDIESDLAVGKYTLVGIIGRRWAGMLMIVVSAAALLGGLLLPVAAVPAVLATAPIALGLAIALLRGAAQRPSAWESLGFWSIGQLMGYAAMLLLLLLL